MTKYRMDELTDKQRMFVANYTDPTNKKCFLRKKNSAIASGTKPTAAPAVAYDMSKRPHVKAAILEALKRVRITPQFQAKKLRKLMDATKNVWHEGLKVGVEDDNEMQHKALVTSLKITDALETLEKNLDVSGQGLSIHMAPELAERLVRIAAEMKMMREAHHKDSPPLIELKQKGE